MALRTGVYIVPSNRWYIERTVWFAATRYCVMANALYWLGAEPRLNPATPAAVRTAQCPASA